MAKGPQSGPILAQNPILGIEHAPNNLQLPKSSPLVTNPTKGLGHEIPRSVACLLGHASCHTPQAQVQSLEVRLCETCLEQAA